MILKIDIEKSTFFVASTVHNKGTFDEDSWNLLPIKLDRQMT
jgi:hypothetical protein